MNCVNLAMQQICKPTDTLIYTEIIEQPSSAGVRFRYKCEGRSAGCIRGASSSEKRKTYPTVKLHGFCGEAWCIVSCVTKDGPPHYPHPHNLVGKETNGLGYCCKQFDVNDMTCSFPNLGIQCVKRKDIKESLMQREQLKVDPYETGFSHCNQPNRINLNVVRLCFQVIVPDNNTKLTILLPPVISNPIYDNKAVSDLTIAKLSHNSSSVIGGQDIILLCDQVNKDDIEIVFYEEKDDEVIWFATGKFLPHNVHRKAAISFKCPQFRSLNISSAVIVSVQLRRPSDGAVGKPKEFTYLPLKYDPDGMVRRKLKFESVKPEMFLPSPGYEGHSHPSRNIKKAVRKRNNVESVSQQILDRSPINIDAELSRSQLFSTISEYSPVSPPESTCSNYMSSPATQGYASEDASSSSSRDMLNMDTKQICSALPTNNGHNETDSLQRLSGLDLGFDSKDLNMNLSDINLDSLNEVSLSLSFSSIEIE